MNPPLFNLLPIIVIIIMTHLREILKQRDFRFASFLLYFLCFWIFVEIGSSVALNSFFQHAEVLGRSWFVGVLPSVFENLIVDP